jgi:hypothetical protein
MSRTKELPSSTNSPHTRTVLPRRTTGKKITRPDTSIPNKHWNIRIKLLSGRKKLIGSPRSQRGSHKGAWARRTAPRRSTLEGGKNTALQEDITQDAIQKAGQIVWRTDARWPGECSSGLNPHSS